MQNSYQDLNARILAEIERIKVEVTNEDNLVNELDETIKREKKTYDELISRMHDRVLISK